MFQRAVAMAMIVLLVLYVACAINLGKQMTPLIRTNWRVILGFCLVLMVNLTAIFYLILRKLGLKESGRKLAHRLRQEGRIAG